MSDSQCRFPVDTGKEIVDCILPQGHTGSHVHARKLAMLIQDAVLEVRRRRQEETEKLVEALRTVLRYVKDETLDGDEARDAIYEIVRATLAAIEREKGET